MTIPCIARVLVVDNDPGARSQLSKILKRAGYIVQAAEGQGVELGRSAKRLALAFKPHVVIMDLRLADEHTDDRSGLELWKEKSFSSARCILYSAHLIQNYKISIEALQEGVEHVIGKEDNPQDLVDAVERAARKGCSCQKGLSIVWPSAWNEEALINSLHEDSTDLPPDLVVDVFGRLFPETRSLALKALEGTAKSSAAVARGRAVLFQAWPDDREPVVAKLAPKKKIQAEAYAYREYIQDRLVGRFYAELQNRADFWELGGICYSFMGSSLKSMEPFASFYRQTGDPQEIIKPLKHFFGEVWRRHYSSKHLTVSGTLLAAYDEFLKIRERLDSFPMDGKTFSLRELPGKYPNPAAWLKAHEVDSFVPSAKQAVTHGDLHGDNLFVEEGHAWAIDFERTGMGPILRDFVELEEDIITRLVVLPEKDLRPFYHFALALTRPLSPTETILVPRQLEQDREVQKAVDVINGLRSLALEAARYEDMHEYYWGLLLDAFFSLKLVEPYSPKWLRGLVLTSLLCARLKDWGRVWPPADWPAIDIEKETGGNMTSINIGNITIGNGANVGDIVLASEIQKSFNKAESADIQDELKEVLKQLAAAVNTMNKHLPTEQAAEAAEDLARLVEEATKPAPVKKWYSVSIDGLIKAAENVEKVGEPVINLSGKVLSLLTGRIVSS